MSEVKCEYAHIPDTTTPIHVDKAIVGNRYTCPECKDEVYPKNQGTKQRHHFVHFNPEKHNTGESPLHSDSKMFLLELFTNLKNQNQDIYIIHICPNYNSHYPYTLIEYPLTEEPINIPLRPKFDAIKYDEIKYYLLSEIDDIK